MSIPAAAPLEEFLEHLNITETRDEAELLRTLRAATGAAEGPYGINGPIIIRPFTARLAGSGALVLPRRPVVSVETVTHTFGYAGPYGTADLDVDPVGIVQLAHGARIADGSYTVEYTAGRWATEDDVDEDVRLAVCIIGKHLWETQRGRASRPGMLGRQSSQDETEKVPMGFLIPNRAATLLAPYWQPGTV